MRGLLLCGAAAAALLLAAGCADDSTNSSADSVARSDSTSGADAGEADAAPADVAAIADHPSFCVAAVAGLHDITGTPASPYYVRHPANPSPSTQTVVFLPGGAGSRNIAELTYQLWLQSGDPQLDFRVVVPYAADGNFTDETQRATSVLDEVLACYGGDASKVHLGGTSNGGVGAFALMLAEHARFATLLGAPGVFSTSDNNTIKTALTGKAVFNGVGENDAASWKDGVAQTHKLLQSLGVDSTYEVFKGQGHILAAGFDQTVFFKFWSSH
ncbi:MAG: hypothetical protein KC503_47590 [Myxococcales bacterium]|nr:hypothetical protein [Myxococcales bacterium]